MILSANSDMDFILKYLDDLVLQCEKLNVQAMSYASFQAQFNAPITNIVELTETRTELDLKKLLWDSLKQWEIMSRYGERLLIAF